MESNIDLENLMEKRKRYSAGLYSPDYNAYKCNFDKKTMDGLLKTIEKEENLIDLKEELKKSRVKLGNTEHQT